MSSRFVLLAVFAVLIAASVALPSAKEYKGLMKRGVPCDCFGHTGTYWLNYYSKCPKGYGYTKGCRYLIGRCCY